MDYVQFTVERVVGVIAQLDALLAREFPYKSSEIALKKIKRYFSEQLKLLQSNLSVPAARQLCDLTKKDVSNFLSIIGLLANSSNVRSIFEFHDPFWKLASRIISPEKLPSSANIHLIISSEWKFSPFVYTRLPQNVLQNFILIGLPASEAHNPLLFPLAGHELGHVVWDVFSDSHAFIELRKKLRQLCYEHAKGQTKGEQVDIFADRNAAALYNNLSRHIIEFFCDCFGLRLFGEGFFWAFSYFFLPLKGDVYTPSFHPLPEVRFDLLNKARQAYKFDFDIPESFELPPHSCTPECRDLCKICGELWDGIIDLADKVIPTGKLRADPSGSHEEKMRIMANYQQLKPTSNISSVADVINAGWEIYNRPATERIPSEILFDLIAKNFEVMSIESRIRG
jgi:hypothetical protein